MAANYKESMTDKFMLSTGTCQNVAIPMVSLCSKGCLQFYIMCLLVHWNLTRNSFNFLLWLKQDYCQLFQRYRCSEIPMCCIKFKLNVIKFKLKEIKSLHLLETDFYHVTNVSQWMKCRKFCKLLSFFFFFFNKIIVELSLEKYLKRTA